MSVIRRGVVGVAGALALAASLAACSSSGGSNLATEGGGSTNSASVSSSAPAGSPCPTQTPKVAHPKQFSAPHVTVAPKPYTMRIHIACKGTVVVAMNAKKTPATVNSFAFLAAHHWFDNTPCHRLTTSGIFVLQCGDPTGTGTGGPGYTIPDENLKGATYPAGTVAMANTGQPHSGGSQFFIVYENTQLPPRYTPFGRITQGLDIIRAIAKAGEQTGTGDGPPVKPVVISSLTVTKG